MTWLDSLVFVLLLSAILAYGIYSGRNQKAKDAYLLADRSLPWWSVLLGVMATQASAITFLSAPGQAYTDGMRFVQYYFGLPLAMVVISVVFIPIFRSQKVYTAYEYLEQRFDRRTRTLSSVLFLLSRGLSTGISIYAPSIIVSTILGWNIYLTNVLVGGLLMVYTWRGGAKAVANTQTVMFLIIMLSMAASVYFLQTTLPTGATLSDTLELARLSGTMNVITTTFDLNDKYTLWSGLIGGFFLALSYFGTDQSQVGRWIAGKGVRESRIGLLLNGVIKVPMQFGILLIGAMLVGYYSLLPAPVFFNPTVVERVERLAPEETSRLQQQWLDSRNDLRVAAADVIGGTLSAETFHDAQRRSQSVRSEFQQLVKANGIAESNDANYVFLHFVRTALPAGMVGLIFAVIMMASWGSISAALHSLATASYVDFPTRIGVLQKPSTHTLLWGIFSIGVSMAAARMGSLIEAVNVLGSLFYGPMLGIFLTAFFVKKANGKAVFYATLIAEAVVVTLWMTDAISFLWLNAIGAVLVMAVSGAISSAISGAGKTFAGNDAGKRFSRHHSRQTSGHTTSAISQDLLDHYYRTRFDIEGLDTLWIGKPLPPAVIAWAKGYACSTVALLGAENPQSTLTTEEDNIKRHNALLSECKERNLPFLPALGLTDNWREHHVLVAGITPDEANDFRQRYDQTTVLFADIDGVVELIGL